MKTYSALIAGLGNPGPQYELTRHNFGFLAADALVDKAGGEEKCPEVQARGDCETRECRLIRNLAPMLVAKPQTYMNLSGVAVGKLAGKFALTPGQIIVIHDDLDLALGRMKFKRGGSDAGHNGIRSIAEHLGTVDFYRLRLGIGRPEARGGARDYVLDAFEPDEMDTVDQVLQAAVRGLVLHFRRGFAEAVRQINAFAPRGGENADET